MTEDKKPAAKVSEFPGRRPDAKRNPLLIEQPVTAGGDQGAFKRPPCGDCIHWQRSDKQLDQGLCVLMPPTAFPIPGPNGVIAGVMNVRPNMQSTSEGCDQFEDEEGNGVFEDDDEDPEPEPAAQRTGT